MAIKIFTLAFNEETQTFHDDVVSQFCVNKRVYKTETRFFMRNYQPFWTVVVHYGHLLLEDKMAKEGDGSPERQLDDQQKELFIRLKEWRKEVAGEAGLPVYMIATNSQLVSIIKEKCTSLEELKLVRGFGKRKIEKYGKSIMEMVTQFYQTE